MEKEFLLNYSFVVIFHTLKNFQTHQKTQIAIFAYFRHFVSYYMEVGWNKDWDCFQIQERLRLRSSRTEDEPQSQKYYEDGTDSMQPKKVLTLTTLLLYVFWVLVTTVFSRYFKCLHRTVLCSKRISFKLVFLKPFPLSLNGKELGYLNFYLKGSDGDAILQFLASEKTHLCFIIFVILLDHPQY